MPKIPKKNLDGVALFYHRLGVKHPNYMKAQSKPELRSKIKSQELTIKKLMESTEEIRRNCQFALDQVTDDRNRYARLYDEVVEENQANRVKLWIVITVVSGAAIFFGTIVACSFFNL